MPALLPVLLLAAVVTGGCGTQQVDGAQDTRSSTPAAASPSTSAPLSAAAAWEAAHAAGAGPPIEELAPGLQPSTTGFDTARAWQHVRRQVAFGPRPSGSGAIDANRRYIIEQLQAMGIGTRQQAFFAQTPAGEIPMINVIGTIPGRRRERIIIGSHFDTKRAAFRFVGANDGASSTAALLEIGRVLRGRQPEFTMELLFLDGEEAVDWDWGVTGEDNTYGSRHYVAEAGRTNRLDDIAAFVLLDMIGERDLRIMRDGHSTPWLVDIVWNAARRLGHASVFVDEVTQIEDDHISFLRAGVPAIDIIDLDFPQWHTADDTLEHLSPRSLQIVGDVVLTALPDIEKYAASRWR
jgi:glutaminyl-peptide cyclotransferase